MKQIKKPSKTIETIKALFEIEDEHCGFSEEEVLDAQKRLAVLGLLLVVWGLTRSIMR